MNPHDEKHKKRINRYLDKINGHFDALVTEISIIVVNQKVSEKIFKFRDYKTITNRVSESLKKYQNNLISSIKVYSQYEWDFANAKVDDILKTHLEGIKGKVPSSLYVDKIRQISIESQNQKAFEAFQERKHGKFTISERVWKITDQAKENLQLAIDVALKDGISAQELARSIKGNLNNPDALFRRVRDKHGNLVLSQNAKSFHPGQGVYRSAHKNALRLAADVINTSYRECEQLRISANNDVVGQKINLSPSHKVYDICDELAGTYPKDFNWSKWHVSCKCFRTTILKSTDELISELNEGLNLPPESSKNFVKAPPKEFDKWISDNAPRLQRSKNKPQFVSENKKYIKVNVNSGKSILSLDDIKKADGVNVMSEDIFKKDGQWNSARQKIHDNIIKEYFKGEQVKADDYVYMLGGAGANGKSTLTESGKLPHPKGALIVDPDKIKGMIPEYKMMLDSNDKYLSARAANFVHEESSYISKEIRKRAFDNEISTVLDGVNDGSAEKIHDNAELIRKMTGKKVRADYVSLDTDLSIDLALKRAKKTGRMVPLERLRADNKAISAEFGTVLKNKSFDELFLWDTNENGKPRLILSQIKGIVKIYDNDLYERFLRKAKD